MSLSYLFPSLLLLLCTLPQLRGLRFYLRDRERRCFKFSSPSAARIIGSASLTNGPGPAELSLSVRNPTGVVVFDSRFGASESPKFAFRAPHHEPTGPHPDDDYDYEQYDLDAAYTACLVLALDAAGRDDRAKRAVDFWIRPEDSPGFPTRLPRAKEGTMERVVAALERAQQTLRSMVVDLASLQQRENRLVRRTQLTSSRLLLFAGVSLVVLVGTSVMQFLHFKAYFRSKKLI